MGDKRDDCTVESSAYPEPTMVYGVNFPSAPVLPETAPWYPPNYPGGLPTVTASDAAFLQVRRLCGVDEGADAGRVVDTVAKIIEERNILQAEVMRFRGQVEAAELTDPAVRVQGLEWDRQEHLRQIEALQAANQALHDQIAAGEAALAQALRERDEAMEDLVALRQARPQLILALQEERDALQAEVKRLCANGHCKCLVEKP